MLTRVFAISHVLYILSVCVTSSECLPQRNDASVVKAKCRYCEALGSTRGASPFDSLWALKANSEEEAPLLSLNLQEAMFLKGENPKMAEEAFSEYCRTYCQKYFHAGNKGGLLQSLNKNGKALHSASSEVEEKLTRFARQEFQKSPATRGSHDSTINSEPLLSQRYFEPPAESFRSLTDLQNENSTEGIPTATAAPQTTPPPSNPSTAGVTPSHTSSQAVPTSTQTNINKPEANSSHIQQLLEELEHVTSDAKAELFNKTLNVVSSFVRCLIDVVLTDLEKSLGLTARHFSREPCGKDSPMSKFFSALKKQVHKPEPNYVIHDYYTIDLTPENIFTGLEDIFWRSGIDQENHGALTPHGHANGPSNTPPLK